MYFYLFTMSLLAFKNVLTWEFKIAKLIKRLIKRFSMKTSPSVHRVHANHWLPSHTSFMLSHSCISLNLGPPVLHYLNCNRKQAIYFYKNYSHSSIYVATNIYSTFFIPVFPCLCRKVQCISNISALMLVNGLGLFKEIKEWPFNFMLMRFSIICYGM